MKIARTEVLALVMLAACAAKSPSAQKGGALPEGRQPDAAPSMDYSGGAGGTAEIETLDAQIRQELAQLGIDPPTDADVTSVMVAHSEPPLPMSTDIASTCSAPPSGGGCDDVCTLADSICGAATRICSLAESLGDDPWAIQRCTAGKLSCERATERCCSC